MKNMMKMGPKGQVVVPLELRKKTNLMPGSMVLVGEKNGIISIKKLEKSEAIFDRIASSGPSIDFADFDSHEAYEESMQNRMLAWKTEK